MPLQCHLYPCRSDNYGVLVRDTASGQTALIDVPEEKASQNAIRQTGWQPTHIFLTHHHHDHVEGVEGIRRHHRVTVTGNAADAHRLPPLDHAVHPGDMVALGETQVAVIDTPGHTVGHIAYLATADKLAFVGDTLFALGCGRMFEGTPDQFHASLQTLAALDDDTMIYCGHEYTSANLAFAETVDPDLEGLATHAASIRAARAAGKPTVPTRLGDERAFNPFLRAADAAAFTTLRAAKDTF